MKNIIVFCDSCSSATQEFANSLDVIILPTLFTMEGKEYNPLNSNISYEDYYAKLEKKVMCKTSCINPSDFVQAFEPFLKEGNKILHVSLSSGLSSSYANSVLAKNILDEKYPNQIEIVDTLSGSAGCLFAIEEACKLRDKGFTIQEIKEKLDKNKLKVSAYFTIGSLDHLRRGGRLGTISSILGAILHINPVIKADDIGKLSIDAKFRGRKKAINYMSDTIFNSAHPESKIYIGHTNNIEEANDFKKYLEDNSNFKDIELLYIDHTMGSHCGPRSIAIFFKNK